MWNHIVWNSDDEPVSDFNGVDLRNRSSSVSSLSSDASNDPSPQNSPKPQVRAVPFHGVPLKAVPLPSEVPKVTTISSWTSKPCPPPATQHDCFLRSQKVKHVRSRQVGPSSLLLATDGYPAVAPVVAGTCPQFGPFSRHMQEQWSPSPPQRHQKPRHSKILDVNMRACPSLPFREAPPELDVQQGAVPTLETASQQESQAMDYDRAGQVLGRVVYLESLGGSPAKFPLEHHIRSVQPKKGMAWPAPTKLKKDRCAFNAAHRAAKQQMSQGKVTGVKPRAAEASSAEQRSRQQPLDQLEHLHSSSSDFSVEKGLEDDALNQNSPAEQGAEDQFPQTRPVKKKLRPCKGKRARFRKLMSRIEQLVQEDPYSDINIDTLQLPPHIANDSFLRMKLRDRVRRIIDQARALRNAS